MKNTPCTSIAIKVALFYFTVAGVCQGIQAQSELRFRLAHNAIIIVSVRANGVGPFDFMLDTGADTSIVDPTIAPQLTLASSTLPPAALASEDHVTQTTLSGVQSLTRDSLRTLSLGTAQVENVSVLVQDLTSLRAFDPSIEGILGQNFLSHFNYLLDYRKRVVRFEQDAEIRDALQGDHLPLGGSDGPMFVLSQAESTNRASLRLLLDSGANSVVLMRKASLALQLPIETAGVETTSSGSAGLQVGRVHMLKVGSQQFRDVAVALPAAEPAEAVGDGLLPTALFQTLYVNNRQGFIVMNPRLRKN